LQRRNLKRGIAALCLGGGNAVRPRRRARLGLNVATRAARSTATPRRERTGRVTLRDLAHFTIHSIEATGNKQLALHGQSPI